MKPTTEFLLGVFLVWTVVLLALSNYFIISQYQLKTYPDDLAGVYDVLNYEDHGDVYDFMIITSEGKLLADEALSTITPYTYDAHTGLFEAFGATYQVLEVGDELHFHRLWGSDAVGCLYLKKDES